MPPGWQRRCPQNSEARQFGRFRQQKPFLSKPKAQGDFEVAKRLAPQMSTSSNGLSGEAEKTEPIFNLNVKSGLRIWGAFTHPALETTQNELFTGGDRRP